MIPKNDPTPLATILDWDSRFFGKIIGRVTGSTLTPGLAAQINDWSKANRLDCLYFLSAATDRITTQTAENDGYHLTDIRVTLEHRLQGQNTPVDNSPHIRQANDDDIDPLRRISRYRMMT